MMESFISENKVLLMVDFWSLTLKHRVFRVFCLTHCILGNFSCFFVVCCFFSKLTFEKILSKIPSECQTVWTLIRPDDSSGLIWVQTVCQSYQQTSLVDKELRVVLGVKIYDIFFFSWMKSLNSKQQVLHVFRIYFLSVTSDSVP